MIVEKTIKQECTNINYSNDNYNYIAPASLFTYFVLCTTVDRYERKRTNVSFLFYEIHRHVPVSTCHDSSTTADAAHAFE